MKSNNIEVNIFYECSGTQLGESVFIIGSIELLGNWNISQCLEMHTNTQIYPKWTTKLMVP